MQALEVLLQNVEVQVIGKANRFIRSVCQDSRLANQDNLFVAVPGH